MAGSAVSGITRYSEGRANAAALETAAAQRLEKAEFDVETVDRRARRQAGAVRNRIGTTGIDIASFSDVLADDARESALEKKAIRVSAEIDAQNLRFQAAGMKQNARMSLVSSVFDMGTAVASGVAQREKLRVLEARADKLGGVRLNEELG